MAADPKQKLTTTETETTAETESHDVYLRDGRTLSVRDHDGSELVEVRSSSGQVEVRIVLTEEGPVLQMEAARLQLRATEAVEIASKRVEIKTTEDVEVEAEGDVRINGKMIWLN
jgi:hypothetical protein